MNSGRKEAREDFAQSYRRKGEEKDEVSKITSSSCRAAPLYRTMKGASRRMSVPFYGIPTLASFPHLSGRCDLYATSGS